MLATSNNTALIDARMDIGEPNATTHQNAFPSTWNRHTSTNKVFPSTYAVEAPPIKSLPYFQPPSQKIGKPASSIISIHEPPQTQPHPRLSTSSRSSTISKFLFETLIPKQTMQIELDDLMSTLHQREKVSEQDFSIVKEKVFYFCFLSVTISSICTFLSFLLLFDTKQIKTSAPTLQLIVGFVSLTTNLIGAIGAKFESDRLLNSFLSLTTCLVLLTLLISTFSIISTEQMVRKYELAQQQQQSSYDIRTLSYSIGIISICLIPLQCLAVTHASKMLTTMKAVENFVETLTLLMFPIGCMFISGGIYIIQNVADSTTGGAALFMFIIGCFVIILSALGYFGVKIPSRGLLLLFQWIVLISTVILFFLGLWSLFGAEEVLYELDQSWESTRIYLPPTFQGRYDRLLFNEFIKTNLQMMSIGILYTALFFLLCALGAGLMRQEIATEKIILQEAERTLLLKLDVEERQLEEKKQMKIFIEQGMSEEQAMIHTFDMFETAALKIAHYKTFSNKHRGELHALWQKNWSKGSIENRQCVKCGCFGIFIALTIIVGCIVSFLVYTSFCEGLSSSCVTQIQTDQISTTTMNSMERTTKTMYLNNTYTRGTIEIIHFKQEQENIKKTENIEIEKNKNAIQLALTSCSLDDAYKKGSIEGSSLKYWIRPVANPSTYFGADKTCQVGKLKVHIPKSVTPFMHVHIETETTVNVHGTLMDAALDDSTTELVDTTSPRVPLLLHGLSIQGKRANINLNAVSVHKYYTSLDQKDEVSFEVSSQYNEYNRVVQIYSDLGSVNVKGTKCIPDSSHLYTHGLIGNTSHSCSNRITGDFSSTLYPVPSFFVETVNGFVDMSNMELINCDLNIVSKDSASTTLSKIFAKCVSKYCRLNSRININAKRGSIQMDTIVADTVQISTTEGRVFINALTQLNPETGITIVTKTGEVTLQSIVASGNIEIDTEQGNIKLTIPMCGKYPAYSGTFQIAYDTRIQKATDVFSPVHRLVSDMEWKKMNEVEKGFEDDKLQKSIVLDTNNGVPDILTGTIGCHFFKESCPYTNEIVIKTESGRVSVVIDENRNICGE